MAEESVSDKLAVEEYKACRDLIVKNIEIMEKNEVYALGAAAALFVFSISASDRKVALASAFTPVLVSALGALRFYGLDKTIDLTNAYLIDLEGRHRSINWATFYKIENRKRGKSLKKSRVWLWIAFNVVCILFAIAMWFLAPPARMAPANPTVQLVNSN